MTASTLILRSLVFHLRSHLGVILGSAVGSAALVGALVVGDSVRESLREQSLQRLGQVDWTLNARDRLFRDALATDWNQLASDPASHLANRHAAAVLQLPATASLADGSARANQVQLIGVAEGFTQLGGGASLGTIPEDGVVLNPALAGHLGVREGDTIVLRVRKPSALSQEAIVAPQADANVALRLKVSGLSAPDHLGNFSLLRSQIPPFNAFVSRTRLQRAVDVEGRANLLLVSRPAQGASSSADSNTAPWQAILDQTWTLEDAQLELTALTNQAGVELHSPRIFLDAPVIAAAQAVAGSRQPILTYLVNLIEAGDRATPYSMVTAAGPPWVPDDMADDEILVNAWLSEDLETQPGASLRLTWFRADSVARLIEHTHSFRLRGVVPMEMPHADRTLMPEFPGIAKAESAHSWDAGFPLVHEIRTKDDDYWKEWRGTPKAFITLQAGQTLWTNRFGNLTAIRFPPQEGESTQALLARVRQSLQETLRPADVGYVFEPVRAEALKAASQSQDFAQLFLGFSFFLVLAALILMGLLFQFGVESRLGEVGTLLALGFPARQVRRLWLLEGTLVAALGGLVGVPGGILYAKGLLLGLTTLWRDAVGTSALAFHARPLTYLIGFVSAIVVSAITIALVLRRQARQPARALLAGTVSLEVTGASRRRGRHWPWISSLVAAFGIVGWALSRGDVQPGAFFGAGSLFLVAGITGAAAWLHVLGRSAGIHRLSLGALGLRSVTRQRKRSLATMALLASGCFMIVAVGANRLDASLDAHQRGSGTGGFALIGESTLPIVRDLNQPDALEFYGLNPADMTHVSFVPMRLRPGDEASCLNLTRAQKPRLLGVNPALLDQREAFTFAAVANGLSREHPWNLLRPTAGNPPDVIPAIGDAASIQWALGKKLGDTLDYVDARGRPFRVRLVASVANSILQGNLLIDEQAFRERFPDTSGYRMFLIDAPSNRASALAAELSRTFQDAGLELTPAPRRLADFNAVQNTYLDTFQSLGGIGLLLGSAGLGVVVLRNVLERRGELALFQAVGFRRGSLKWLVLSEHGVLLAAGLIIGLIAALVSVLPVLLRPGASLPLLPLGLTLAGVLLSGLLWTWLATRFALRGALLPALRHE